MDDKIDDAKTDRRRFFRIGTNLRIKFRTMEEFRTEYTRNISREGIFVDTKDPLPLTEYMDVTLELPPPRPSMTLMAQVVHVITSDEAEQLGVEPGMGLHFVNLTSTRKKILESYIHEEIKRSPATLAPDRRRHPRRRAHIKVKFASNGALQQKYSHDISKGGIFIKTKDPEPIDTPMTISLIHPVTGEEINLESRVVRHIRRKDKDKVIRGMALIFTDFKQHKEKIEKFVDSAHMASLASENRVISGEIEDYGMPQLLSVMAKSIRAGHINLIKENAKGIIGFEDEKITHAELTIKKQAESGTLALMGEKALFRILEWKDGRFEFATDVISGKLDMKLGSVIEESARQAAQIGKISKRSLKTSTNIRPTRKAAKVDPPEELKEMMKCLKKPISMAELLNSCSLPDLEIYDAIMELEKKGFIEIKQ